jgi:hypothetical protein
MSATIPPFPGRVRQPEPSASLHCARSEVLAPAATAGACRGSGGLHPATSVDQSARCGIPPAIDAGGEGKWRRQHGDQGTRHRRRLLLGMCRRSASRSRACRVGHMRIPRAQASSSARARARTQAGRQAGRHWYSQAVLAVMRLRGKEPAWRSMIALPDFPRYRDLHSETVGSLTAADIEVWWVDQCGGSVRCSERSVRRAAWACAPNGRRAHRAGEGALRG